jgi:hypothetical protein
MQEWFQHLPFIAQYNSSLTGSGTFFLTCMLASAADNAGESMSSQHCCSVKDCSIDFASGFFKVGMSTLASGIGEGVVLPALGIPMSPVTNLGLQASSYLVGHVTGGVLNSLMKGSLKKDAKDVCRFFSCSDNKRSSNYQNLNSDNSNAPCLC